MSQAKHANTRFYLSAEELIDKATTFTNQLSAALSTLRKAIPNPDSEGLEACIFLDLLTRHIEYFHEEMSDEARYLARKAA